MVKFVVIAFIVFACVISTYFLVKSIMAALEKDRVLESKSERVVTAQVVKLGAPRPPAGVEYIFAPDFKESGEYDRGDCVIIRFNGEYWYNSVRVNEWPSREKSVEELLLNAAQRTYNEFKVYYKEHLRKEQLRSIVSGKGMLKLGDNDDNEWKEDK